MTDISPRIYDLPSAGWGGGGSRLICEAFREFYLFRLAANEFHVHYVAIGQIGIVLNDVQVRCRHSPWSKTETFPFVWIIGGLAGVEDHQHDAWWLRRLRIAAVVKVPILHRVVRDHWKSQCVNARSPISNLKDFSFHGLLSARFTRRPGLDIMSSFPGFDLSVSRQLVGLGVEDGRDGLRAFVLRH